MVGWRNGSYFHHHHLHEDTLLILLIHNSDLFPFCHHIYHVLHTMHHLFLSVLSQRVSRHVLGHDICPLCLIQGLTQIEGVLDTIFWQEVLYCVHDGYHTLCPESLCLLVPSSCHYLCFHHCCNCWMTIH
uniref:Uncharacterized protein n=1 Tax=Cacopsylla melanoneura TaxID=428564 RepID=A0A8D8SAI9_9HEMI